jgi:hypothetical protein
MMQAAQHWYRDDPATRRRLDRPGFGGVFLQCQVHAGAMKIVHKCPEVSVQASLGEHDQVIQATHDE